MELVSRLGGGAGQGHLSAHLTREVMKELSCLPIPPIMMLQVWKYNGSSQSSILSAGNIRNDLHYHPAHWFMCKQLKKGPSLHCNAKLSTSINGTLGDMRTLWSLLSACDNSCKCFDFPVQMS